MRTKHQLEVEGRTLTLTNLEKVLYPAAQFTKANVIDYYARAAPWILPHLKDRPITLKRFPDGVTAKAFYEKDAPRFTPDWVRIAPVPRRAGGPDIRYILINDLPTLIWCANIASLELHPFLHRAGNLESPTAIVFDLDPGEGATLVTCAEVAFILRAHLARYDLESLAKVSGSKGLQVYVPLNTGVTYAMTQPFARSIAQLLEKEHPELIVSEMAKNLRPGKVFIDWSQNSDFKTTVGVYSLRAKRDHPFVSLPVEWSELEKLAKHRDPERLCLNPQAALDRVAKVGDLFAPVLSLKQKLPGEKPSRKPRTGAPERLLPQSDMAFIEPMQAKLSSELPEGTGWQYEIKLDGYRALAIKKADSVELLSRNNRPLGDRFGKIAESLRALHDGTILDGEVVALDPRGRPSFNLLQNHRTGRQPVVFYVFDVLAFKGQSLVALPLSKRREFLSKAISGIGEPVRVSAALDGQPAELMAVAQEQGLEGVIAKRLDSVYEPGRRSGAWVKVKVDQGQELVIGGYKPGQNGFENLAVGYYEHGKLQFLGKVRNGFVPALKEEVAARFKGLESDKCPFANLPEPPSARRGEALTPEAMKKYRWLRPKLVAQIGFADWTEANHLRHARFIALRDDKDPRKVIRERAGDNHARQ